MIVDSHACCFGVADSSMGYESVIPSAASLTVSRIATFLDGDAIKLPEEIWAPFEDPNLSIDVSFPVRIGDVFDFPYGEVVPTIEEMVERIGAERLLWGPDMPYQNRHCTYRQSRDHIEKYCPFLGSEELRPIMGGSAARILGLQAKAIPPRPQTSARRCP